MANMYLRFDPLIEGGSQADKFVKQIVVSSYSWGTSNDGSAVAQDFHFTAATDRQSPRLMQACADGTQFNFAELTIVSEGDKPAAFHIVKLTDVLVSSYQTGGASGAGPDTDQTSLRFSTISNSFSPQKADGTLEAPIVGTIDFGKPK
jgi:type VI secretion system secreted protein Hcp